MKLSLLVVATAAAATCSRHVKTGLDVLIENNYAQLAGKKVLILTNPTGVTPQLDLGVDVMIRSGKVDLVGVMGPEHGFRGTAQAGDAEGTFVDEKTGLTVYDAYLANTTELMGFIEDSGADTVLFDIQDVGARFYTYLDVWAMYDTMIAAAKRNVSFVVIDRPNPTTGLNAFGPVLNESFVTSYVGRRAIAQSHGMTVGELAHMFIGEGWISEAADGSSLSLNVIRMENWQRWMTFHDTGLPWVMPSPNMPTMDTAMLYPGTCMFEGVSLSEGRGTTRPFELLGAPWGNESWVSAMRELNIANTQYRFQCFTPTANEFQGKVSCGLQTYANLRSVEELEEFDAPYVGVSLLYTARKLYAVENTTGDEPTTGAFHWVYSKADGSLYNVDLLTGSPLIREGIEDGLTPEEIRDAWLPRLDVFREKRKKYLLY
ncbi:unnamed protein product [Clonostachys rhizophaga]|uniref:DUF1343 domain-containing protein n=1 Tax=Clonostachys rhizophaga TaxID=160324 RepID=A0A9N9VFY3_9HYPO|nr:unnamed protein product [Clonostachys rhizophaga]